MVEDEAARQVLLRVPELIRPTFELPDPYPASSGSKNINHMVDEQPSSRTVASSSLLVRRYQALHVPGSCIVKDVD